jgi:DeoR family ulaG and ulaABCDEF operon transcriptional repressor
LERISTLITDEGISDKAASVLAAADVKLIVVQAGSGQDEEVA